MTMNLKALLSLAGLVVLTAGCATYVGPVEPSPVVYYGYYGNYYGYYHWNGPVVVHGAPYGWHGRPYYYNHYRGNWHR